ncbi:hypothetical protein Pla110_41450 [Polystyrenella longa]|uniref:Uncharacterized protein n=1 Tax=Polystyrenella longa TaxID=2528007 RepID=A0A518CT37_9PLAN|nr:hypothetical protein [Polystyrenella longa]QDU82390.1 hypothetical protein Pla110_41450 [Polystyrenella longa]
MAYQQVKDIVGILKAKHRQIRDALESPRSRTKSAKVALLLEGLRKDEQELQLMLGDAQKNGERQVLETWLQYVPDEELQATVKKIQFTEHMTIEQVIEEKMKFDLAMLEFLDHNIRETSIPKVEEFFTSLREYVRSRAAKHAWATREDHSDSELPQVEL